MGQVVKGTIVYYYDTKAKKWLRGKTVAVNRHHVTIRTQQGVQTFSYRKPVVPASEGKPTCTPEMLILHKRLQYQAAYQKEVGSRYRLMQRLGIIHTDVRAWLAICVTYAPLTLSTAYHYHIRI